MNRFALMLLVCAPLLVTCDGPTGRVFGSVSWTLDVSNVDFTSMGMPSDVTENQQYEIHSGKHTVKWESTCCSGTLKKTINVQSGESLGESFLDFEGSGNPRDRVYDWQVDHDHVDTERNELVDNPDEDS
ncbi:MAG TPA: hypothetical protein VF678_11820 [bacterium]